MTSASPHVPTTDLKPSTSPRTASVVRLRPIDRDAFALSEIRMEIGPRRDPRWTASLQAAEQQTPTSSVQAFHGVVHDQSGAVIPEPLIDVMVKGTLGKTHAALFAPTTPASSPPTCPTETTSP